MARIFYSFEKKQQARRLRVKGISFKDIGKSLGVAKSTARLWTKDIKLTPEAEKRLYTEGIKKITASESNQHHRRLREIAQIKEAAREELEFPLSDTAMKLTGAMMYWAEGRKNQGFEIVNSDPLLISFMVHWFQKVFHVTTNQLIAALNIYPQQSESELKQFWSELTKIPLVNFRKTFVKPKNKNYKKNTLYYGTIRIRLQKGSDNRERVFGWVKALLDQERIDISKIETRWNKLRVDYPRQFG